VKRHKLRLAVTQFTALGLLASLVFPSVSRAQQAPVFVITRTDSSIKFNVKASVAIQGTFDQWNATLKFTSPDVTTGVLDVTIQAASVDTGSGLKDSTLKGSDFFAVDQNPLITFKSTKIVQTGPNIFEVDGDFTIRGVTKPEKLTLSVSGRGTGSGEINGTMAFDRHFFLISPLSSFQLPLTWFLFIKRTLLPFEINVGADEERKPRAIFREHPSAV
jgi:polyisoprenoid-binding protein YceI